MLECPKTERVGVLRRIGWRDARQLELLASFLGVRVGKLMGTTQDE